MDLPWKCEFEESPGRLFGGACGMINAAHKDRDFVFKVASSPMFPERGKNIYIFTTTTTVIVGQTYTIVDNN